MKRKIITIENGIVNIPQSVDIWMTQHEITDLFGCFLSKVNSNIRSILKAGVLYENAVCRTYRYENGNAVELYNLEMIIALAFRIRSHNAEVFREWLIKKTVTKISEIQTFVFWNSDSISLN